jgi:hypothetical protein
VNYWQFQRNRNGWHGGLVEWIDGNCAFVSVVFSWQLSQAYQCCIWHAASGLRVFAGGPAVEMNPGYLSEVAECGGSVNALPRHNARATFTSRGCCRECSFCAVPRIEGGIVELKDWELQPIVCDNNLLACSRTHFDSVIDRLKQVSGVDFNQGLDARLLNEYHASRIAELNLRYARLSWDHISMENQFMEAFRRLRRAGLPLRKISAYVLIGWKDTPQDALYRLRTVHKLGILPFPMRYQPIDILLKNSYVAPGWTHRELQRYVRYWSNLNHLGAIPFEEFEV